MTPALPVLPPSSARSFELLDILLRQGAITKEQYEQTKLEAIATGTPLDQLVLLSRITGSSEVAKAKGELYHVPFVDIAKQAASPEALMTLPESVARRYASLPISVDQEQKLLTVAMENPLDLSVIEFLEKKTGYHIRPVIAPSDEVRRAIEERYAQSLSSEVTEALKETEGDRDTLPRSTGESPQLSSIVSEAPITKIVDTMLEFAMKARASDIHIEPLAEKTRVRYRIDGMLREKLILPRQVHESLISRVKILSDMKIDEKRLPQDGRFNFHFGEEEVDLRVSSLPTAHGEKIVMRLLKKSGKVPDLSDLGLRGRALKNLEEAIRIPHGIVLITGPTGSGKTTTLYSILHRVNQPTVNIVTIEDPVEYQIPGVSQVQVNVQAGLTFASGLRSFLRQDPNIIMVGEIRDRETTELTLQASLTGHLVFSTLHTNSASGAIPRLLDMHAEPFLLASTLTSVIGQRVARRICEHCREMYDPPAEVVSDIHSVLGPLLPPGQIQLSRGKGCPECSDTGYHGLIAIFEVLPVTEKIARLILERKAAGEMEQQASQDGMIFMKQDGYLKALEGITTIEEVLRVAQA